MSLTTGFGHVATIASREFRSALSTPLAYVIMAGFSLLSGFFFFGLLQTYNAEVQQPSALLVEQPNLNILVIAPLFKLTELLLVFLVPLLTMRTLAEERSIGTFELLATSPISATAIAWGKFFGVFSLVALTLAVCSVYPLLLVAFTDPEVPPIFVGLFGLLLFAGSLVALGIATSALTQHTSVAGIVAIFVSLLYYAIETPAQRVSVALAEYLQVISPVKQLDIFRQGVIGSPQVVYFLSVIVLGVFFTSRFVEAERWR